MKLKDLILEKKLEDTFRSEYENGSLIPSLESSYFLYRGASGKDIDSVKKMSPRKNRRPTTTKRYIDEIIHNYQKVVYPRKPFRRSSIFCTTSSTKAKKFGKLYYVFFPKTCKVYKSDLDDSFGHLNPMKDMMNNVISKLATLKTRNVIGDAQPEKVREYMKVLDKIYDSWPNIKLTPKEAKLFIDGWNIVNDIHLTENDYYTVVRSEIADNIMELRERMQYYYKGLTKLKMTDDPKPVDNNGVEVMAECEYYYMADRDWFEANFRGK